MMGKYGLHVKLKAKEGKGNALASILLEASKLMSTAKGCHLYIVSTDKEDKDCIWVTEVWNSKEDHSNALKVEGVMELIAQAFPMLEGQPEKGRELDVLGGAGIL